MPYYKEEENNMSKKVIIVTGASSGFGKDTVKKFLKEGNIVYAGARRVDRMKDIADLGAKTLSLDVTSDESVNAFIKQIMTDHGRIDALVNNAGYGAYGMVEAVSLEDAQRQYDVNVFGAARMTKAILPHMRSNRGGTIINISSIAGKLTTPMCAWYSSSKFALEAYTDALRREVKQFGINVVLIEPGAMNTGFFEVAEKEVRKINHPKAYQKSVDAFLGEMKKAYKNPPSTEKVVNAIVSSVYNSSPNPRYTIGTDAKMGALMAKLPDKMQDAILIRMYS